jgi:hypothetical protein
MKKFLSLMSCAALLSVLTACDSAEVTHVKKLSLPYCESYTVGEVMDSLMQKAYWGVDSDISGKTTVVVEGMIVDDNRLVPVEFKFSHASVEYAELLTFAIEQRAQPTLIAHKYFARVCSDDYLAHFESGFKSVTETAVEKAKNVADGVKDAYKENEQEINEFSDKVISVSGKLLNKAIDKVNEKLEETKPQP